MISNAHASVDAGYGAVVVRCYAIVVLLLGCCRGGGCCLGLGVLLCGVVVVLLMVVRPVSGRVLVLVGEDVALGHHGCDKGADPVLINGEYSR